MKKKSSIKLYDLAIAPNFEVCKTSLEVKNNKKLTDEDKKILN